MAETNHIKTFLSNPISYVSGMIALGAVVFAWGVSSANKGNDLKQVYDKLDTNTQKINDIDAAIKTINNSQVTISSQVFNMTTEVNVLSRKFDTQTKAVGNHLEKENMLQDKIKFLQELIDDEKKNFNYNQYIPTQQNMNTTLK
jgi:peptidoglycan hydrolase CwlO-like protein